LISKPIYTCLFLFALLVPVTVLSQVRQYSQVIQWTKPAVTKVNDTLVKSIHFEGAFYEAESSLPLWTETIFQENISEDVIISDCNYIPATIEDNQLITSSSLQVPSKLTYSSRKVMSRKRNGVYVEIIPFLKEEASGRVSKLSSFTIQFAEKETPEKASSRTYAGSSVLSQGNWFKLGVTETGVYQISYNDLTAMGITPSAINPAKIGIFGRGGSMLPEANSAYRPDDLPEIAIEVTGQNDGSFDPGDQILFYAQGPVTWKFNAVQQIWEHTSHLYADTICYFLTTDRGTGKRLPQKQSIPGDATDIVDSFDYTASFDENNINLLKSGRQWFAQTFDVIPDRSYAFNVPALSAGGEVKVRTVTAASSVNASSFLFNIGSQSWMATHSPVSTYSNSPVATGAASYKSLQSVSLPLSIGVKYNRTSPTASGYLDLIDINARCALRFTGGQLAFRDSRSFGQGRTAKYILSDAAGKVRVWEVTNLENGYSVSAEVQGNNLVFSMPADTIRQFMAFDESGLMKPIFIQKIDNQDLHAIQGIDLLVLAPQAFMSQAVRLATFHANTSDMDVLVLDPAAIYNEFSSGTVDITAIRDFIKMLYDRSLPGEMPCYLLLFGDASYDYKDKITANTNFIPTWQSPESFNPISSLPSDDYYGTLDDAEGLSYADIIDIGIGRLPVKTPEEAEQAVDKIIHYSVPSVETEGDWRNIITFVADDEDLNDHIDQAEQMAVNIENSYPDINLDKIYLDSYVQVASPGGNRYPDVNKAITQRIEKGSLILNYTGHGGETGWAHEEVLTVNEINNWSNFNNLPVFVTATCEFSRFDDPGRQAAGEMVFTNPKGGGIALFTTTRPTYGTPNFELNKKFYQYAMSKPDGERLRMGDIIMNSKRDKGANENGRKYVLLGDPALKINFPSLDVVTLSINGRQAGSGMDTLTAYMEVTVEGLVADEKGDIVGDFNGTVFPSVFDKSVSLKTIANDGGSLYSFRLRKNLLYKGKVNVVNGHFAFTFIVPKDIAYRYDSGKISYYASDGTRDATGSFSDIIIGGSSDEQVADTKGPDISLYMNDLLFRDGGITDQNPRLLAVVSDENGINTIGNGIGHDITAILDGNTSEPYILNDFYESDIDTFKSGYIWFPFSLLPAGEHNVTVKVWDIFNNSSEAEINFVVYPSGEFVITNTYNFPNPFREYTDIVFEHNQQNVEFNTRVEIYTITGQLVHVIEQTDSQNGSVSNPIRWDGRGTTGEKVTSGIYVYNLIVSTSNGLTAQKSGKIAFNKGAE